MSLFTRHLAWLHSKPSKQDKTRFQLYSESENPSILLESPRIDYAEYLLNYLFEIGYSKNNGFGLVPIDFSDVHFWRQATGTELTCWESLTIVYLSKVYVDQWQLSNGSIISSPYQPEKPDKKAISNQVASVLRSIKSRPSNSDHGSTE